MSEPIKAGDLVMVVRWPHRCESSNGLFSGFIGTVEAFHPFAHCRCGEFFNEPAARFTGSVRRGVPVSWLKKIDPPAQSETTERSLELQS